MTKYEWERQLKKGISGLPKSEQQRVLDYYNELFADKIDAGLREQYIISEFGNPYDVANKILVDYFNRDKENPEVDEYIYADSDDIDETFDESDEDTKKKKKGAMSVGGLATLIAVLAYCVLGACFDLWHPGWLIFLLLPCVITLVQAITRRNYRIFAYPVLVAFVYLLVGFYGHKWHPTWVLFLTIPIYYVLGNFVSKNDGSSNKTGGKERNDGVQSEFSDNGQSSGKRVKSGGKSSLVASILKTVALVFVAFAVWGAVLSLFASGIGMLCSGAATFVASALSGASEGVNMVVLGAAFAQVGLGLICTFGMAALFKPCFNMCKSFAINIKNSFESEETSR
ncbi:MAG: DUF1700 domain-containing protein [Corallococcus sp.]|nr:DUF1700 domain-containing protein [Corallococcus sp.]